MWSTPSIINFYYYFLFSQFYLVLFQCLFFFSFCSYLDHVRQETPIERAGGYTREYPCLRAIEEAFDMLLFVKENFLNNIKKESSDENESMET